MANEARVTNSLSIRKQSGTVIQIDYQSRPNSFSVDVTGTKGPVPGAVAISTGGTDVSFAELTTPSLCRIHNQDATNYVEYGIWEPATSTFYPFGEIGPGETYILKLSRNFLEEYSGTGTGTTAPTNTFRMKANGAACNVLVEAFEK